MYKLLSKVIGSTAIAATLVISSVASSGAVTVEVSTSIGSSGIVNADFVDPAIDTFIGGAPDGANPLDASSLYVFEMSVVQDDAGDPGASISFDFLVTDDLRALNVSTENLAGGLDGLTFSWFDGLNLLSSVGAEADGSTALSTGLIAAGTVVTLVAEWTGYNEAVTNVDFRVSAVPLPPALLMLVSALLGLGFLSRRRAQATA